jgi:protein gp37
MSDKSAIEWTDATWNPVTGCTEVTPGCDNCYAKTFAERWRGVPGHYFEQGFDVVLRPDKLNLPLTWRKPRRVFVNSMSDLFHKDVPDEFIARVFAVMAATPQHTYQLLTKRHGRMRSLLAGEDGSGHRLLEAAMDEETAQALYDQWPLPNVWLGVSVEDQARANLRIPALLDTPAAVRWLSMEPLLGPVDLTRTDKDVLVDGGIDWVVVGGESGRGARPMEPAWARSLRDQVTGADVPFFFKQWGEWAPNGYRGIGNFHGRERLVGPAVDDMGHREVIERLGKKAAGRELDGRTWDEYPAGAR